MGSVGRAPQRLVLTGISCPKEWNESKYVSDTPNLNIALSKSPACEASRTRFSDLVPSSRI